MVNSVNTEDNKGENVFAGTDRKVVGQTCNRECVLTDPEKKSILKGFIVLPWLTELAFCDGFCLGSRLASELLG